MANLMFFHIPKIIGEEANGRQVGLAPSSCPWGSPRLLHSSKAKQKWL